MLKPHKKTKNKYFLQVTTKHFFLPVAKGKLPHLPFRGAMQLSSPASSKTFRNVLKRSGASSPAKGVSSQNRNASRALLQACLRGDLEEATSLFQQNPDLDVNQYNLAKETPLFFAAAVSAPLCRFLLERGANPLVRAVGNRTVAHQLALLGDAKLWEEFNQLDNFKKLLKKDLQTVGDYTHPLHLAARKGNLELLRDAFPQKWDLDVKDIFGSTPLIIAVAGGKYEVALYLLSKNVKLGITSVRYRPPEMLKDARHPVLHLMIVNGYLVPNDRMYKKVMKELIAQKAPLGCLFCSEGNGCTSVAKRRVPKYRALKDTRKTQTSLDFFSFFFFSFSFFSFFLFCFFFFLSFFFFLFFHLTNNKQKKPLQKTKSNSTFWH